MKTIKTVKYIACASLALASLLSCDKFLDVNPDNRATLDTEEKVIKILGAAYPEANFSALTEFMSDNYDDRPLSSEYDRFHEELFYWKDIVENDEWDGPEAVWAGFYDCIANANAALDAAEAIAEKTGWTTALLQARAEAYLCRAYNHFILVNIFAKHYDPATAGSDPGITYVTETGHMLNPKYERDNIANIYKYIEDDILAALPDVGLNNYTVPAYHFSPSAAYAFAAKFYLYYEKWDEAIKYADKVLGDYPANVLRPWQTIGHGTSQIDTHTGDYVSKDNSNNLLLISKLTQYGAYLLPYGDWRFRPSTYIAQTETRIHRSSTNVWGANNFYPYVYSAVTPYLCTSFLRVPYRFEYTDPVAGIGNAHTVHPAFTTDETLLIRAEARILNRDFDGAIEDLNIWLHNISSTTTVLTLDRIKTFFNGLQYCAWNAGTPKKPLNPAFSIDDPGSDQECLLQCVLHFRRIEMLHWGDRWFDIKRYGIEIFRRTLNNAGNPDRLIDELKVDDPRRAVQIPQKVVDAGYEPNPR